jgi:hypothetical protein
VLPSGSRPDDLFLVPPCPAWGRQPPVRVVWLPGRRAGLEFVEKLLTSAMAALLDGTEREHATARPARSIAGRAGYGLRLLVVLVVVAVV